MLINHASRVKVIGNMPGLYPSQIEVSKRHVCKTAAVALPPLFRPHVNRYVKSRALVVKVSVSHLIVQLRRRIALVVHLRIRVAVCVIRQHLDVSILHDHPCCLSVLDATP